MLIYIDVSVGQTPVKADTLLKTWRHGDKERLAPRALCGGLEESQRDAAEETRRIGQEHR